MFSIRFVSISSYVNNAGQHYYGQSSQVAPNGFSIQTGVQLFAFADPVFDTVPIYRYFNQQSNSYAYVLDPRALSKNLWAPQGIAWYAYPNSTAGVGAVPLLTYFNVSTGDTLFSLSTSSAGGYVQVDSIMFLFASATDFQFLTIPDRIVLCSGDSLYSTYNVTGASGEGGSSFLSASGRWYGIVFQLSHHYIN